METINFFTNHPQLFLLTVLVLSLLVGSFLNVVIYRLPQMMKIEWSQECREFLGLKTLPEDIEKINLALPLSHCTQCKSPIKPWHNIPIISYLLLGGKCADCSARISLRYPLVEVLCGLMSAYVAWRFGVSWQMVGGLIFTWIAISLTFIDLDHHLLPDQLTLLLVWVGLFLSMFNIFVNTQDAIIGAIAGYLIFAVTQGVFRLATGKVGMGQGDYKFLAGLGALLGWQQLPIIILIASVIGIIFGVTQMALRQQFKSVPIPFGPYLAVAGWISLIWGQDILNIYIHKFIA